MAISLHEISVANYLQSLGAVSGFLDRGLAYLRENNIDPEQIVETRLYPDMLRSKGVPVGKRDFLGTLRKKT